MAARRPAFDGASLPQLLVKILRNDFEALPSHFSRPFRQLVGMILRADPDDRPTAARLMMLPIVKTHLALLVAKPAAAPRPATAGGMLRMCQTAVAKSGTGDESSGNLPSRPASRTAARTQHASSEEQDVQCAKSLPAQHADLASRLGSTGKSVAGTSSTLKRKAPKNHTIRPPKPVIKVRLKCVVSHMNFAQCVMPTDVQRLRQNFCCH
jgi:hypothetical protein